MYAKCKQQTLQTRKVQRTLKKKKMHTTGHATRQQQQQQVSKKRVSSTVCNFSQLIINRIVWLPSHVALSVVLSVYPDRQEQR